MEHITAAVIRMVFLVVFIGWLFMWVMLPTKTYKNSWSLSLADHLNSTYFREQGTNLVLFSFPIIFLACFGCLYLHFQTKSSFPKRRRWLDRLKRPLIVMNPLGIVSLMELMFAAMFVALLGWSLYNYLHVSFEHLHMHKVGEKVWEAKFRSVSLRLGYIGNITWAFLFFPVTRGSSILRLVGLTSESSVKYHIWLGHISMVLFSAHSVGFIIYWAITDQLVLMKEWSKTYLSNVAGEIAFVLALIMWVTSIPRVRRKMFEIFFYTHQTYIIYLFFYIIHVGVAYFCLILPGIFLFLIDRYLRFLQSRTHVKLIVARLLPSCDALELNFSKTAGLEYNPTSILFVNVPSISKLQWHPFTVTSNMNSEPDMLSVVIKCQGTWSHKLYQKLSGSPIDRLQVSVEGPYGPTSSYFLCYENIVLISGGSGITPFISIIRELTVRCAQQQQSNKDHKIPTSVLLICAFKNLTDLSMIDLLFPLTSNGSSDLSQINLKINAYITRETEQQQPLETTTKKPLQTIWFKPTPSDSPISAPLGPNSWLWLCVIISSSFVMFLVFLGILIRYHIYPKEHSGGPSAYNYTFKTLWDMFFVCASVLLTTSLVFLWQRKEKDKTEGMKVQNLELGEIGDVENFSNQCVVQTTEVHFGHRPDLKRILMENNKNSDVGVLVCGPRKMRHEVAKICSSKEAKNLHLESMSFNW